MKNNWTFEPRWPDDERLLVRLGDPYNHVVVELVGFGDEDDADDILSCQYSIIEPVPFRKTKKFKQHLESSVVELIDRIAKNVGHDSPLDQPVSL